MKKTALVIFAALGLTAAAQAQGKIGTVDLNKIFEGYYKTEQAKATVNTLQNNYNNDRKIKTDDYAKRRDEVVKLRDEANNPALSADIKQQKNMLLQEKGKELLALECDVLSPCALENALTGRNAGRVAARAVVEGANGPTTGEADAILARKGVLVAPDILCNCGGVVVSYFEWVQDREGFFWTLEEINARLRRLLVQAFEAVYQTAQQQGITLREAATMLAVSRVAEATLVRGIYP